MTRWRGLAFAVGITVAVLAILLVVIYREGPDRTITGRITSVESHQVCVAASTDPPVCVEVDSPEDVASVSSGDCVRLRYSAQDLLVSLNPASPCG